MTRITPVLFTALLALLLAACTTPAAPPPAALEPTTVAPAEPVQALGAAQAPDVRPAATGDRYPWLAAARQGQPVVLPMGNVTMTWGRYAYTGELTLIDGPVATPSILADGTLPIPCPGLSEQDACVIAAGPTLGVAAMRNTGPYLAAYRERLDRLGTAPAPWVVVGDGLVEVARGTDPATSPAFCRGISLNAVCLWYDPTTATIEFYAPQMQP